MNEHFTESTFIERTPDGGARLVFDASQVDPPPEDDEALDLAPENE